jgi:hypothetical protein
MYGLGVNRLGATSAKGFNPATLFADGTQGAWYDMSDLSTMFKVDGTTPAVVGEEVGKILDKSGKDHHLVQTNSDKCPILRIDDLGNPCLDFVTDDGMRTLSVIPFQTDGNTTAMSVIAAARKESTGLNQTVVELSNSVGGIEGAFRLFCTSGELLRSIQKGTVANSISSVAIGNPSRFILTSVANMSTPRHLFRRNGAVVSDRSSTLGTAPYKDHLLSIGGRANGASANLDGKIYAIVIVGKEITQEQIEGMEQYMSNKSGVSL